MYLQLLAMLSLALGVYGSGCVTGRSNRGYWDRLGNLCYGFFDNDRLTEPEARKVCSRHNGNLAMPRTLAINEFMIDRLRNVVRDGEQFLIGIEDDFDLVRRTNLLKWNDGTELHYPEDFSMFAEHQGPNASMYEKNSKRCFVIDQSTYWFNARCGRSSESPYKHKFICEKMFF